MRPKPSQHPDYYGRYIALVKQEEVMDALTETSRALLQFIRNMDVSLENFAYAEGKWTVKQVLIHCMDTERVFSTRALGYARGEKQKALAYDENIYADNSHAQVRTLADIAEEYEAVSRATCMLFKSFNAATLAVVGETPSGPSTINAIGFAICGHNLHHMQVLNERYLNKNS